MTAKGKTALPKDWEPSDNLRAWAKVNATKIDLYGTLQEFRDYSAARDWRMADWDATFRNWLRKASKASAGKNTFAGADKIADAKPAAYTPTEFPQKCKWQAAANRLLLEILHNYRITNDRLPELVAMKKKMGERLRNLYGGSEVSNDEWRTISQQGYEWMRKAAHGIAGETRKAAERASRAEPADAPSENPGLGLEYA